MFSRRQFLGEVWSPSCLVFLSFPWPEAHHRLYPPPPAPLRPTGDFPPAQAQACFYEKAVKDRARTKLKPTIIAKLAAKARDVRHRCRRRYRVGRPIDRYPWAWFYWLYTPSTASQAFRFRLLGLCWLESRRSCG